MFYKKLMIKIIRAEKKHAGEILRISKNAFTIYKNELHAEVNLKALSETETDVISDIENNIVFAAVENGEIKGSVRIKKLTDGLAYIYRFAVNPDDQNLGVGGELINAAVNECAKLGFAAAALHTNSKYYKLARYYYGKEFYVHSTTDNLGYIRALFVKELKENAKVDLSPAFAL